MKRTDEVLARRHVDRGLASDGGVRHRDERRRGLHDRRSAVEGRRDKPREIADDAAAEREDRRAAIEAAPHALVADRLIGLERLARLARLDHERIVDGCVPRDVLVGDHEELRRRAELARHQRHVERCRRRARRSCDRRAPRSSHRGRPASATPARRAGRRRRRARSTCPSCPRPRARGDTPARVPRRGDRRSRAAAATRRAIAARRRASSTSTPSATTSPAPRMRSRLSPYVAAPPPVAITASSASTLEERGRLAALVSPRSRATSCATGSPIAATTSSRLTNPRPVAAASAWPTEVFPAAMNPIRKTAAYAECAARARHWQGRIERFVIFGVMNTRISVRLSFLDGS